jgi:hypothetical protein
MADKFPGSWSKVLVLAAVIVAAQAIRVAVLQPVIIATAQPTAAEIAAAQAEDLANRVTPSARDALAVMVEYESSFTPELDARARSYAEQVGLDSTRLPPVRSMFLLLANRDMLVEPGALMAELPEGWEIVCGSDSPEYVCVTIASHLGYMAEHHESAPPMGRGFRGGVPGGGR